MSKTFVIGIFLGLLAVALAFGIARDLYSSERRVVTGEIIEIKPLRQDFKATLIRPPQLKVRLDDGTVVDAGTSSVAGLSLGAKISVSEMVMPWGQIWYRLKG